MPDDGRSEAWNRGQALTIHGWIFGLTDGLVRDLEISIDAPGKLAAAYERAGRARTARARKPPPADMRIGVDLGGTKIEIAAFANDGGRRLLAQRRIATPAGDYLATVGDRRAGRGHRS